MIQFGNLILARVLIYLRKGEAMNTTFEHDSVPYKISHEGKEYQFDTLSAAQDFLDKLPSGAEVKMANTPLLIQLINTPGAPIANWREIIEEIDREFWCAATTFRRAALLHAFTSTMDIVETTIPVNDLGKFREARHKRYQSYLVEEAQAAKKTHNATSQD